MNFAPLGIADLVRSTEALRTNPAGIEAVARMCGLELAPRTVQEAVSPRLQPDSGDGHSRGEISVASVQHPDQPLPASVMRLRPVRHSPVPVPTTADPLATQRSEVTSTRERFEGLLDVRDAAALVRLAASVPMATDRIDVERAVWRLAQAKPLTSLPLLQTPSLAFGAQVLVDIGLAMQPFMDDQEALLERIRRVLRELADVRYFADDPASNVGPRRRRIGWEPYALPQCGTPVLAITDLGCGFPRRRAAMLAWQLLAQRLRRRQCRLVVFAPVRLTRIPLDLRRAAHILLWDRTAGRRNITRLATAQDE